MKNICIIPARGGSKRIPRKNIKEFLGKPIIAYSIEAALKSGLFDEVMVSTDDEEIAAIARQYGASVPFMRSAETANDYATTADVLLEVIAKYRECGREFDALCCLYATAPFVRAERLRECYNLMQGDIDSAFTVVEYSYPIQRSLVTDGKLIRLAYPEHKNSRSQDLQKHYHDAGQFYFSTIKNLEENKFLWGEHTAPLVLSELEVQDLDTMTDWQLAEMKYKLLHE
ncbi:MAG: pseudaminic acid cytidylyltransferase [Prevotellaceae bacterium]|nr:pseudaminic acid cytidylyltransferase [Candidatus Faecinaster equi]